MAYIGKYLFCVVVSAVLYCVQCSLRCTPTRYPIQGLSTARWEAVGGGGGGGGKQQWRQRVMVVIVLLYTLSHSAISVLKIMSPSNEVRLLLLFIISCHSRELRSALCLGDVFKRGPL